MLSLADGTQIQLRDWVDDKHYDTMHFAAPAPQGHIPTNPAAARFLFQAIAYAENALQLPSGSAYPHPGDGSDLAGAETSGILAAWGEWTVLISATDSWLIAATIDSGAYLLRVRLNHLSSKYELLVQALSADGLRVLSPEGRSRDFSAIDKVLATIRETIR
jgi:hypothetical protein